MVQFLSYFFERRWFQEKNKPNDRFNFIRP
jgi:hypothetical protein